MAGRDLEALSVGIREILDERYLEYRMKSTEYVFKNLKKFGIPMLQPCGGHAIYIDGIQFMQNIIKPELCPAQALSNALYLEGGVRSVEVGTVMFGKTNKQTGFFIFLIYCL